MPPWKPLWAHCNTSTTKASPPAAKKAWNNWGPPTNAVTASFTTSAKRGAVLEATENLDVLLETLDLQRCLMMPLASPAVAAKLQDWYSESNRKRYEHIGAQLDATLGEDEVGLLLISERHQVQFPSDIEVFYVSPPALDEFRRWMQNWMTQQQNAAATRRSDPEDEDTPEIEDPED